MRYSLIIFTVCFSFLVSFPIFAEDTNSSSGGNKLLERRIQDGKFQKLNDILDMQKESKQLFKEDREALYNRYYKSSGLVAGAFVLNFFIPGTGSFLLGDVISGTILLSSAVTGGGLLLGTMLATHDSIMGVSGVGLLALSYLLGWVVPFTYSGVWNNNLKIGLNVVSDWREDQNLFTLIVPGSYQNQFRNIVECSLLAYRF